MMADKFIAPRSVPSSGGLSPLREAGLKAFSIIAKSFMVPDEKISLENLQVLQRPLENVSSMLEKSGCASLYSAWSPSREQPLVAIAVPPTAVSASNTKSSDKDTYAAFRAVEAGPSYWMSDKSKTCTWNVDFGTAVQLGKIQLELRSTALPESLEIEVTENATKTDWKAAVKKISGKDVKPALSFPLKTVSVRHLRITLYNHAASGHAFPNTDNAVAIIRAQFFAYASQSQHQSTAKTLDQIATWLGSVHSKCRLTDTSDALVRDVSVATQQKAIAALLHLACTSARMSEVLSACQLLATPGHPNLTPQVVAAAKALVDGIRKETERVRKLADEKEYNTVSSLRVATAPSWGPLDAFFDPKEASTGVIFSNENRTIRSENGNYHHCLVNLGTDRGFTEGKATWEFKLVEDTDSQCTCFGASTKPVTNSDYNSSTAFFMYRCYNGYRYANGSNIHSSSDTRVFKGDTIKFELDFDEGDGVIRCSIKGVDKGVIFTGLRGKEIWPAVAFYGSGRVVDLLSVEGPSRRQASVSQKGSNVTNCSVGMKETVFLANLPEVHHVSQGQFGRNGDLGIGGVGAKAKVGGVAVAHSISIHPPPGRWRAADADDGARVDRLELRGYSSPEAKREKVLERAVEETKQKYANTGTVVYLLEGKYEQFSGSVALDDSVKEDARNGTDASPVYFEIYGDNTMLWRSSPFHQAKTPAESFKVSVLNVNVLRLVTRCVAGNAMAWVVWVDPTLVTSTDWTQFGWRHDREEFMHAFYGTPRHTTVPLPDIMRLLPEGCRPTDDTASVNLDTLLVSPAVTACAIMSHLGQLAQEHLRMMRGAQDVSGGVDAELRYVVQLTEETVPFLRGFLEHLLAAANTSPHAVFLAEKLLRIVTINLRHVYVTNLSPADTHVGKLTAPTKEKKPRDKKKKDQEADADAATWEPSEEVDNFSRTIAAMAKWGDKAAGNTLVDRAISAIDASKDPLCDEGFQNAVWDFVHLTKDLVPSHTSLYVSTLNAVIKGPGTLEIQLGWPLEEYDDDGALLQLETALLQLQLHAKLKGWKYQVLGHWPAKLFLLVEVPESVLGFLQDEVQEVMESLNLEDWWDGLHGGDGMSVVVERAANWNRQQRLAYEPGFGVVRVYPSFVCSFDDVLTRLQSFVPKK